MSGEFRNGLCSCCESIPDCLLGYFLPCVEAGLAARSAGQDTLISVLQCFFYPLLVPLMRYQVREQRGIGGNVVEDLALGWCCPCCTAIQIKREFE